MGDCCSVWDKRKVPILVISDLPQEEDPPITSREQVLATRYYLRIHPPQRLQGGTVLPTKWDIPMAGVSAGVARVLLLPSIGYGVNASYRVEYVAWRPILNGTMVNGRPRIRVPERVVKEEYWKVPHSMHQVMEMRMVHHMDRDTIPVGMISPISVRTLAGEPLEWDILELPMGGTHDKSLRDISIKVDIPIGEEYIIEYIQPLTLKDVVIQRFDRTHTEDIPSCHASSHCCPPLPAPWGYLPSTRVTSTPWFY
ncbi:hypothetical protein [Microcoleus phage My-WqHQDG]|nr:hypothetical protein [Microcoleus phage My-WqHQDG]